MSISANAASRGGQTALAGTVRASPTQEPPCSPTQRWELRGRDHLSAGDQSR